MNPVELEGPPPREWDKKSDDHPWLVLISKTYPDRDYRNVLRVSWTVGAAVARESAIQIGLDTSGTPAEIADRVAGVIGDHLEKLPRSYQTASLPAQAGHVRDGLLSAEKLYEAADPLAVAEELGLRGSLNLVAYKVANRIHNGAYQLISAMCQEPKKKRIEVDFFKGQTVVEKVLELDVGVLESMEAVMDGLTKIKRVKRWDRFRGLPYADETASKKDFLVELTRREEPPYPLDGFWFGISYPSREGYTTLDGYAFGGQNYDPANEYWPEGAGWEPKQSHLESGVLSSIYDEGYRRGAEFEGAEIVALAYTGLLARELTRHYKEQSGIEKVGACFGYDSGDVIHLGWL